MVPRWCSEHWYEELRTSAWRKAHYFPPGEFLFLDHRAVPLPPTVWAVELWVLKPLTTAPLSREAALAAITVAEATEAAQVLRAAAADHEYQYLSRTVRDEPKKFPEYEIREDLLHYKGVVQIPAGPLGVAIRDSLLREAHDCQ